MTDLETHDVPPDVERRIRRGDWTLTVDGRVDRPGTFSRSSLASMETVETTGAFACVEGWTATDLTWRGVRVTDLLDRVEPLPDAAYALVHAMDGDYACSFSLDRLDGALLAVGLAGDELPVEHGGPARLVPASAESDCWESVKWVERIEFRASAPDDTARDIALARVE